MTRFPSNHLTARQMRTASVLLSVAVMAGFSAHTRAQTPAAEGRAPSLETQFTPQVLALERKLEAAKDKALAGRNKKVLANALNELATFYFHIASTDQALASYAEALTAAQASGDEPAEATALNGLGDCWRSKSKGEQAAANYQRALTAATMAKDLKRQAAALNGLGRLASEGGDDKKAEQLHSQSLELARSASDAEQQAAALNGLGIVQDDQSEVKKALELYGQALTAWRTAGDHYGEGNTLNNIAIVYAEMGEADKALDFYNQALRLRQAEGDRAGTAGTLNNLGVLNKNLGKEQKAMEYYLQVLPIEQALGNRGAEATALNNIGNVCLEIGENRRGLKFFGDSLVIRRALNDRQGEAGALLNIGMAYIGLGEIEKALESLEAALSIWRASGQRRGEARALNGIGVAYDDLGDPKQALEYYTEARTIYQQIGDRGGEADTVNNIAGVYNAPNEKQKALDYYNQAYDLEKSMSNLDGEALTLNNMGLVSEDLKQPQKAFEYFRQAFAAWTAVGDRSGESHALDNAGSLLTNVGQPQDAAEYFVQALALATGVGDPVREAQIYYHMMLNEKRDQAETAVFHGKQAVNYLQQVRSGIQGLDKALQKSFLASKEEYYRDLADLLIAHGRLAEAQQVLDLEKEQEYADYVRGESGDTLSPLALTPAEKRAAEDYRRSTAQTIALGEEWAALKKAALRTDDEEKRLKELTAEIDSANKGLDDYYKRLYLLLGGGSEANRQLEQIESQASDLQDALARMPRTVALYTLVSKDRYRVIVITGSSEVAREYAITDEELNRKIAAFGEALRGRRADVKELAGQLYAILVGPVKADLEQAHAETIVWSLDGVLRYIPMAALYDGKQYLVEKYNLATITPVILRHIEEKPDVSKLSVAAMGISRQYRQELPELPAVASELKGIVHDTQARDARGVLPGTILLNNEFTEKAMEDQLGVGPAVVHIASHFVFNPGDDNQSYLLLAGRNAGGDEAGSGYELTVADFRSNPNLRLSRTALLTLSACETGKSGSAGNGREVDGLGTTAMKKGARAVISTLWSVDDRSTGVLMADFYKRWADGEGKVTKAEALRQAQLDLLHRKDTETVANPAPHAQAAAARGFSAENPDQPAAAEEYAHPYYWAPFVLMGNWQ